MSKKQDPYVALARAFSRKHYWMNRPSPYFLLERGFSTEGDDSFWQRNDEVFCRAGEVKLPVYGRNISRQDLEVISSYADSPFKSTGFLHGVRLVPVSFSLIPASCIVCDGLSHYSSDSSGFHVLFSGFYASASLAVGALITLGFMIARNVSRSHDIGVLKADAVPEMLADYKYGFDAIKALEEIVVE